MPEIDLDLLAGRLATIEGAHVADPLGRWGHDALHAGLSHLTDDLVTLFHRMSDEDIARVMFTNRRKVKLTQKESNAADTLTITMLLQGD